MRFINSTLTLAGRLLRPALFWLLAAGLLSNFATAATIFVTASPEFQLPVISITGTIEATDGDGFSVIASQYPQALVKLNSPGGNLLGGLQIGKIIRHRNFSTAVIGDSMCASICAVMWLAGTSRYTDSTAKIGFHAAASVKNGVAQESGAPNAVLGSFLGSLGLSDKAIAYLTSSAPNSMTWLTPAKADELGLNVKDIATLRAQPNAGNATPGGPDVLTQTRKEAEQGHAQAQYSLGLRYAKGEGVAQDYAEALKWYRMAAEQGLARAQCNLGVLYDQGRGTAQNYAEAMQWFRKAAEQGNATAQYNLGIMYYSGHGAPQNHAEAMKWFRLAAEQGMALAQCNLGVMYDHGQGVAQNYAEAMKWFRKAADQGNAVAQYNLGIMYHDSHGVAQNHAEALKWFRLAAEQGEPEAQFRLGAMYAKSEGVAQDNAEAEKWFRKAAERGNEHARNALKLLSRH